jgi:gliding motility-associated-like protein
VSIDTALLPENFTPVIFEIEIADTVCGSAEFHFLLSSVCPSVFIIENYELCPGDSILIQDQWISEEGQYEFLITGLTTLCDTVLDVYVSLWDEMVVESMVDWNCQTLGTIILEVAGDGPFNYDWYQGLPNDSAVFNLDPGTFAVDITDVHGCMITDSAVIEGSVLLEFYIQDQYEVEQGDSVFVSIMGDINEAGLQFEWNPSGIVGCHTCSSSWIFPLNDTILTIQITDADSCIYWLETEILLTIEDDIFAPNVFSPNGDGINDFWKPVSRLETTFVHHLAIFDRWGNTMFMEQGFFLNAFAGWDGTFKEKPLNPGVFVFVAEVTLGHGERVILRGDVTLLR